MKRTDIDLEFHREFATGSNMSPDKTREQREYVVRHGMLSQGKEDQPFRDTGMSYAQAYRKWTGEALERRRTRRPDPPPLPEPEGETADSE